MPFAVALSGLNAASSDLNVTANNIANANTTGFKGSRAEFADVFAVGAQQIGNGVRLSSVSQEFKQGGVDFTDRGLDFAISGEGFFTVERRRLDQVHPRRVVRRRPRRLRREQPERTPADLPDHDHRQLQHGHAIGLAARDQRLGAAGDDDVGVRHQLAGRRAAAAGRRVRSEQRATYNHSTAIRSMTRSARRIRPRLLREDRRRRTNGTHASTSTARPWAARTR